MALTQGHGTSVDDFVMRQPPEFDPTSPSVVSEVREFYDRYPYPQPVDSLDNYRRLWQAGQRRRANYHLFWLSRSYREDYSILIAGRGTSQAAKHAMRWPAARIIGTDFSTTSVRCTETLKQKYNLRNLSSAPNPHRAGRRPGNKLRSNRLHWGSSSSRGP